MNAEIIEQLKTRLATGTRTLDELHHLAAALGSTWSRDEVELCLLCLPELERTTEADGPHKEVGPDREVGRWQLRDAAVADPLTQALLALAGSSPITAAALVARLPPGVIASAPALIAIAKTHPQLEVIAGNRIRRR